jgi:uncharacterized protein (DUF885 family)
LDRIDSGDSEHADPRRRCRKAEPAAGHPSNLASHTVLPPAMAQGEIDRYISWPGQASSYMVGRTEILELREQARSVLGSRFDIRAFHDRVLEDGWVPLGFLRRD